MDERMKQLGLDFVQAHDALLVKSLDQERSFAEAVDDFRQLEAEFVARSGDSESAVLEARRRVAETILALAHHKRPPFEACREAWNERSRLGFSNLDERCTSTWFYADCCAYEERPDEGLAVIEPLLADLAQRLEQPKGTVYPARFYDQELESLGDLRDELEAQQRGEPIPWRETRRADEAYHTTPEEEQADALFDEFREGRRAIYKTFVRSPDRRFADVMADYRRLETDILARAGAGEAFQDIVLAVRVWIAEAIFTAAYLLKQPFEICRDAWNDLVRVGFQSTWQRWRLSETYAQICEQSAEPEAGLAVVDPLIEEISGLLEKPKQKLQPPPKRTRVDLERRLEVMTKIRDELEAQRRAGEDSG